MRRTALSVFRGDQRVIIEPHACIERIRIDDDRRRVGIESKCLCHDFVEVEFFGPAELDRSEEHTSELQSLMRISYAVFCLTKKILPVLNITSKIYSDRYMTRISN